MNDAISDDLLVLNAKGAIESLGDEDSFNMLLEMLEESLQKSLKALEQAMNIFDYKEIRMQSHSLKGPSGYVGGERLRRAAEIVQFNVDHQEGPNIFNNYPLIIEESIKLRREVRRYKCIKKLNENVHEFKESEEDTNLPVSVHYKFERKSGENPKVVKIGQINFPPVPFLNITPSKPAIKKDSAPAKKESVPIKQEVNSAKQETLQVKPKDPPIKQEPAPVKKEVIPAKQEPSQVKPANTPLKQEPATVKQEVIPAKQESPPEEKKKETTGCSCALL